MREQPAVSPDHAASLLSVVDRHLAAKGSTRWDAPLRERLDRDMAADHARQGGLALLVGVLLFDAGFLYDVMSRPGLLGWAATIRFGFVTPLAALTAWVAGRMPAPRWKEAAWAATLAVPMIGAQWLDANTYGAAIGPVTVLLTLLFLNIVPVPPRAALAGAGAGLCGALLLLIAQAPGQTALFWGVAELCAGVFALVGQLRLHRAERRAYLYGLRDALQVEMLTVPQRASVELATHDLLTSAADQRLFDSELALCWEGDPSGRIAVLLIDLDQFAAFNDHFGRPAGDQCLTAVAATIQQQLRTDIDLLARYDGEEFAVMLPGTDYADAAMVGERIRAAVQELAVPHPDNVPERVVTVSVGCAAMERRDGAPEDLLDMADRSLFAAKQGGRNRVAPQLVVSAADRMPAYATAGRRPAAPSA